MSIDNALASVAVKDLDMSAAWYGTLLGTQGKRPMPEVAEWTFSGGGGLQEALSKAIEPVRSAGSALVCVTKNPPRLNT